MSNQETTVQKLKKNLINITELVKGNASRMPGEVGEHINKLAMDALALIVADEATTQRLHDTLNPNVLGTDEKHQLRGLVKQCEEEVDRLIAMSSNYGDSQASEALASAHKSVVDFTKPIFDDMESSSKIDSDAFRAVMKTYYEERTTLLNYVAGQAGGQTKWARVAAVPRSPFVSTNVDHVWHNTKTGKFHFADETDVMHETPYDTLITAKEALDQYCRTYLGDGDKEQQSITAADVGSVEDVLGLSAQDGATVGEPQGTQVQQEAPTKTTTKRR